MRFERMDERMNSGTDKSRLYSYSIDSFQMVREKYCIHHRVPSQQKISKINMKTVNSLKIQT